MHCFCGSRAGNISALLLQLQSVLCVLRERHSFIACVTGTVVELAAVQVSVDISTPPSAFEAVEAAAVAHFKANPNDFSGEKMIIANIAGDPLKYMLCVWWEYAYPGEPCKTASKPAFVAVMLIQKPQHGHPTVLRQSLAPKVSCSPATYASLQPCISHTINIVSVSGSACK